MLIDTNRKDKLLVLCSLLAGCGVIVFLAFSRNYCTFGTETDYLGSFIKEAQRVLDGEPLKIGFHPPFYPITLAIVQSFVNDWVATGLIISCISSIIVQITVFYFFYRQFGKIAAWGSFLGLFSSNVFLTYSAFATSDMFFLAVYSLCFLISFLAIETNYNRVWALNGIVLALCFLTRTNSLTLVVLVVLPWIQGSSFLTRFRKFGWFFGTFLFVILIWFVFAKYTGSPFAPKGNHINFALTYFAEGNDRISADAFRLVAGKFENIYDVISYDPKHIIVTYIKDFIYMIKQNFRLISFPLNLFVIPGLVILVFTAIKLPKKASIFLYVYLVSNLLQIALVNLKYYEMRYFLFLAPIFGAGMGLCADSILKVAKKPRLKSIAVIFMLISLFVGIKAGYNNAYSALHLNDKELSGVVSKIRNLSISNSAIVARKPHVPFYTGNQLIGIPTCDTLEELRLNLQYQFKEKPIYIYYGSQEQHRRPQFSDLKYPERAPDWLELVAQDETRSKWFLYLFKGESFCF